VTDRNKIIYERHETGDDTLERLQDNVQRTVEQITRFKGNIEREVDALEATVDANAVQEVVTGVVMPAAAPVVVNHSLGRVPTQWWAVRATGSFFQAYETAKDSTTLTLQSSNACTADIRLE
jgi:hypothetical protein